MTRWWDLKNGGHSTLGRPAQAETMAQRTDPTYTGLQRMEAAGWVEGAPGPAWKEAIPTDQL